MPPLVEIGIVRPPFHPGPLNIVRAGSVPFGSLLACHVSSCSTAWADLVIAVERLRNAFPAAPVVTVLSDAQCAPPGDVIHRMSTLPVRAVFTLDEFTTGVVRSRLTSPNDLEGQLAKWTVSALPLSWGTRGILAPFLAEVAATRNLERPCSGLDQRFLRSVRDHLRRDGLPPPQAWWKFLRCLNAALAAQNDPCVLLGRVAVDHGFADQPAMCNAFQRLFALRPSEVRRLLGWEWLAARFLSGFRGTGQCHRPNVKADYPVVRLLEPGKSLSRKWLSKLELRSTS